MKKRICLLTALMLALTMLFACNQPEDPTPPVSGTETDAPVPTVTVFADGKTEYTIIISASGSDEEFALANTLEKLSGTALTQRNDRWKESPMEILIGKTTRDVSASVGEELKALASADAFHYIIAEENGKIVILADDVLGYYYASEYLPAAYLKDGVLAIPEGCRDVQTVTWETYHASEHYAEVLRREEERIAKEKEANDPYREAKLLLSEDALKALKEMDAALFSEDIYRWIAELYDPETGAIYFSISGRDNFGYLPDIETTGQASGVLNNLGIGTLSRVLNTEQKARLLTWVQTLQSNRDGYNYHPHWSVDISSSRRSRDYSFSGTSFDVAGAPGLRLYDDANYRLSGGTSGTKGVTVMEAYNSALTGLPYFTVESTAASSSMPAHLKNEEVFVKYVNDMWNSTCKVAGTHERHFCTDSCVIIENPSDSYMKIVDGKMVITRGYQCTSCHVCKHTVGHSYSFGHNTGAQNSQLKAVGLGDALVMYLFDIQENVQASLRDKAQAAYIAEKGEAAWNALSADEKNAIRTAAENGIWEEEITYNTCSGLMKISGTPGSHGYEFRYAKAAINTAIKVALFPVEDYYAQKESIVSIYNPFNAISYIMSNLNKYSTDEKIRTETVALIRANAAELFRNTAAKLDGYRMPDGGYSYSYSGYCTNSQGQPVAVSGWLGHGEGDVNGTALAIGTRSALLSIMQVSVGAPFSGINALYSENGYDLNGDGKIEGLELQATHTQVFQSLITNKKPIKKVDNTSAEKIYTFEKDDPAEIAGGTVVTDGDRGVLKVVDPDTTGISVTFRPVYKMDDETANVVKLDMKVVEGNNTVTHQLFVDNSVMHINFTYTDGIFTFHTVDASGKWTQVVDKDSGKTISVNAKEWFTIQLSMYPDGIEIDGKLYYAVLSFTQDGVTQSCNVEVLKGYGTPTAFRMYSLYSAITTTYYDNVSFNMCTRAGVSDGEYHFDTVLQKISDDITASPTNAKDSVYAIAAGSSASLNAAQFSTSRVIYNFDSTQMNLLLKEAAAGERIYIAFKDAAGKKIQGIYLEVNADKTVTFCGANGQKLRASIPNGDKAAQQDMTLSVKADEWMMIKLEYHHDLDKPQFDIAVRYFDVQLGKTSVASASLTNVPVNDAGADPAQFSALEIYYESAGKGKIYTDDLFIRNVQIP